MIFLLWTWLGFQRRTIDISWNTRSAEYCVGWGGWGQMAFVINEREYYTGLSGGPDLGFSMQIDPIDPDEQPLILAPILYLDHDRVGIFVGHWFVVLLYTIFWLTITGYWLLRKKRRSYAPVANFANSDS